MSDLIKRHEAAAANHRNRDGNAAAALCKFHMETAQALRELQAENDRLREFIKAFDEMDEYQPYDGYYINVIEQVWDARKDIAEKDDE